MQSKEYQRLGLWPAWERGGLGLAPTALESDVGYNGQENGFFDIPVSLIFRWSFDPNVVGAPRRGAHPRPPRGQKQARRLKKIAGLFLS